MNTRNRILTASVLALACGAAASAQCSPTFVAPPGITYPEGVNGAVLCSVVWDPDGAGPKSPCLVVGGSFDSANTAGFNHIAMWDGSGWKPLHVGVNGDVKALTVDTSNNTLIAGGVFSTAGIVNASKIARFSATSGLWSAIGSGITAGGDVNALAYDSLHAQIYLGGAFTGAGGVNTGGLARITGSSYAAVGAFFTGTVHALKYYNGDATVYVGGTFTDATLSSSNMIKLNTLTNVWSGMNGGLPGGGVYTLTEYAEDGLNTRIMAGGSFGIIGGTTFNGVARWNGSGWFPLASGLAGTTRGLAAKGTELYSVGSYVLTGTGAVVNRVSKWNGSFWQAMGGGLDASANTATAYKDAMYIGGNFNLATNADGNTTVSRITRWDGTRWAALRGAPSGPIRTMISTGTNLLIGGSFDMYVGNNTFARNLVSYDGVQFSANVNLQGFNGTNGPINAILIKSNGITVPTTVVAGLFTQAGSNNALNIASGQFSSEFSQMGSGLNGEVYGLATYQCTGSPVNPICGTVATGNFTASGVTGANYICRFGPGAVSLNMGTGLNAPGRCLLNYNGKLLVGGHFTSAGGVLTGHLAQWDGTSWTTFNGSFVNDTIYAMTLFNGNPVIGGNFININGAAARKVAMWNGSVWVDMGEGIDTSVGSVTALAVHNGELYAGGYFATSGEQPRTLARWSGSSWVTLGGETNPGPGSTAAMISHHGALVIGGDFTTVGSTYTPYLAEYACGCWANCDNSSAAPILNANDFGCFLNNFAAGTSYANCDGSSVAPVLNANDFGCYLNKFAAGCN